MKKRIYSESDIAMFNEIKQFISIETECSIEIQVNLPLLLYSVVK